MEALQALQAHEIADQDMLRKFLLEHFSEDQLPSYEHDSLIQFANAQKDLLIGETKRRLFLHKIIQEQSKLIYSAINKQLDRVQDLLIEPDRDRQELFSEVMTSIWEKNTESLQKQGKAKLSTRVFQKAKLATMGRTKKVITRAKIERKLKQENPTFYNYIFPPVELVTGEQVDGDNN